jgi:hypothetical protein
MPKKRAGVRVVIFLAVQHFSYAPGGLLAAF